MVIQFLPDFYILVIEKVIDPFIGQFDLLHFRFTYVSLLKPYYAIQRYTSIDTKDTI